MRTLYIKDTPFAIFQALYFFLQIYAKRNETKTWPTHHISLLRRKTTSPCIEKDSSELANPPRYRFYMMIKRIFNWNFEIPYDLFFQYMSKLTYIYAHVCEVDFIGFDE